MIVGLKTDAPMVELVVISNSGEIGDVDRWDAGRGLAEGLLDRIQGLLERFDCDWPELEGLVVFLGPGSFTGLRIGCTVANTIAYAQSVPIVGAQGEDWLNKGLSRLGKGDNDKQVTPRYGAPPNITKPKR